MSAREVFVKIPERGREGRTEMNEGKVVCLGIIYLGEEVHALLSTFMGRDREGKGYFHEIGFCKVGGGANLNRVRRCVPLVYIIIFFYGYFFPCL